MNKLKQESCQGTNLNEMKKYDVNDHLIYYRDAAGNEWEYDQKGNEIHYKDTDGHEWWKEYDENSNS